MIAGDAVISADGKYRSILSREIEADGDGLCVFGMLNPSTASGTVNDPTLHQTMRFAAREKCCHLYVVNLFTARSPEPKILWTIDDPVGPDADRAFDTIVNLALGNYPRKVIIIAGWGAVTSGAPEWFRNLRNDRVEVFKSRFPRRLPIMALGLTRDGSPRHPLYIGRKEPLVEYFRRKE